MLLLVFGTRPCLVTSPQQTFGPAASWPSKADPDPRGNAGRIEWSKFKKPGVVEVVTVVEVITFNFVLGGESPWARSLQETM